MKGHAGKTLLGLLLSAALLWWVLRDVSISAVAAELRRADPLLIAAMTVAATVSFVLRALRWHVLLLPAFPHTTLRSRFGATCIGFAVNNLLPARLGEIARAFALSRAEQIGLTASLASLVVERAFDTLVLATFLFVSLAAPGFPGGDGPGTLLLRRAAAIGAVGVAAGFAILWLMVRNPEPTLRLVEHTVGRVLAPRVTDRAIHLVATFIEGLGALHRPGLFGRAVLWSLAVWLSLVVSIWLGLLAFGITAPGLAGSLFVQAVIAFAVALPSSPGFFGVFEAGARVGLAPYGVAPALVVGFATGYHIITFVPVTLLGLWYAHAFGIRLREMRRGEDLVERSVETDASGWGGSGAGPGEPGAEAAP